MSIFDKWNKNIDKDFIENVDAQDRGEGGSFEAVPTGIYEVKIEKMEIKASKKGDPMFTAQFKIIGEKDKLKGQCIWMNQVIVQPFQVHIVNDFLRSLDSGIEEIKFNDYGQFNDLVLNVMETVESQKLEYALEITENEKGYRNYKITEVFESEE